MSSPCRVVKTQVSSRYFNSSVTQLIINRINSVQFLKHGSRKTTSDQAFYTHALQERQKTNTMRLAVLIASSLYISAIEALSIGTGIYDATGPISDVLMMGMANPSQVGAGLHQRLRSRAFVALDEKTNKRFAFVSIDVGMGSDNLNNKVLAALEKRLPGLYTAENVGISGTHTHSGPSGAFQLLLQPHRISLHWALRFPSIRNFPVRRLWLGVYFAVQRGLPSTCLRSWSLCAGAKSAGRHGKWSRREHRDGAQQPCPWLGILGYGGAR